MEHQQTVPHRQHRLTVKGSAAGGEQALAPYVDVLCAVDGSRGSVEAVRQAIAVAAPDGRIRFLAVSRTRGKGLAAMAELSEARGQEAIDSAARMAEGAGVSASTELRRGGSPADVLLAEAARHDLLVVGSRGGSRAAGIMLGSAASQAAHRAESPLLVARQVPEKVQFLAGITLATDGSPGSWAALSAAARVARARRSDVTVVHVPDRMHPDWTREIERQLEAIKEVTGVKPSRIDEPGRTVERIVAAATDTSSSLIVIGRRGLTGVRALGSVSERVLHLAPCSTLIVPAPDGARQTAISV